MEESKESKTAITTDTNPDDAQDDETTIVEAVQTQIHENIKSKKISSFINQKKSWDDEEFKIPDDIMKGIRDGAGWEKPSRI